MLVKELRDFLYDLPDNLEVLIEDTEWGESKVNEILLLRVGKKKDAKPYAILIS